MSHNTSSWLKSWSKPSNLIALASLIAVIFGGFTFVSNRQNIEAEDNSQVIDATQKTGTKTNLGQTMKATDNSTIKGVTQE